ncbi:hypothetical protein CLOLEP_00689 [[Clostridium] leptum DSM 753]|uniref:Uncharacterized protein n=1 Tax=[Clostridium] leptum DSM 753 TaxID=428125 RepID=A7VQ62_9FIRM|nr:hypothetical protein CLOLEP_00689 [[Clostridium] leptum DSM 753]
MDGAPFHQRILIISQREQKSFANRLVHAPVHFVTYRKSLLSMGKASEKGKKGFRGQLSASEALFSVFTAAMPGR